MGAEGISVAEAEARSLISELLRHFQSFKRKSFAWVTVTSVKDTKAFSGEIPWGSALPIIWQTHLISTSTSTSSLCVCEFVFFFFFFLAI